MARGKTPQSSSKFVSRKTVRKQAREQKKQRKASSYIQRKLAEKKVKRQFWISKNSHENVNERVSLDDQTKSLEKKPKDLTFKQPSKEFDILSAAGVQENLLLTFAERAIDEGILGSDGEFDEERMNNLFGGANMTDEGEYDEITLSDSADETYLTSKSALDEVEEDNEADSADSESTTEIETLHDDVNTEKVLVQHGQRPLSTAIPSEKLTRFVQGQINRLTLSNFDGVANMLATESYKYSRNEFTGTFTSLLMGFLTRQQNLLETYILNHAAMVAALAHIIGVEFLARIVEECVNAMDDLRVTPTSEAEMNKKATLLHLTTFLAFLYDLQMISHATIASIFAESILRISEELEVEILVKLLRLCGAQLRRDDAASLKNLINEILQKTAALEAAHVQSSRFKFMVEMVQDLKNNRQKLIAIQQGDMDSIKKIIRSLILAQSITKLEPLNITLDDVRNAKSLGKWWQIGAAWKVHGDESSISQPDAAATKRPPLGGEQSRIMEIAKQQHMNTDLRRTIFATIMTSDDYQDAFQRLLTLKLTSKQERDIVHILLHCTTHEKAYNPFYVLLAGKFIVLRHNFLISFKYAFWDRLKLMAANEVSPRQAIHLAKFYGFLLARRYLSFSVLKKVSFADLSPFDATFFQILFATVLESAESDMDILLMFAELVDTSKDLSHKNCSGDSDGNDDGDQVTLKLQELRNLRIRLKLFSDSACSKCSK